MKNYFLIILLLFTLTACRTIQPRTSHLSKERLVKEYVDEFASGLFENSYPQIYQALLNALNKLPDDVYTTVTDRRRPIIFLHSYSSGIARYANSTEFIVEKNDPPTFQDGFYIVILGDELNTAGDVQAIEGIILHETAHRYLEHLSTEELGCQMEREANRLVKQWGYEEEYLKASYTFGAKKKDDSPCQDQ